MAETPKCSCGSNEKSRIIFPCAGQANTGQLTNLAALQLTEEGYGSIACVALLATGAENLIKNAKNVQEVVVLDGCPMQCAKKIAAVHGITAGQHLVMTETWHCQRAVENYTDEDIETIVSACWKGEGRMKPADSTEKKSGGKTSGCGCGCGGSC